MAAIIELPRHRPTARAVGARAMRPTAPTAPVPRPCLAPPHLAVLERPAADRRTGRRGAIALALLLALAVATVAVGVGVVAAAGGTAAEVPVASAQTVVVGPGDTVLSIAEDVAGADRAPAVAEAIRAVNRDAAELRVGDIVVLPRLDRIGQ